jgi:hypothetical protein
MKFINNFVRKILPVLKVNPHLNIFNKHLFYYRTYLNSNIKMNMSFIVNLQKYYMKNIV